MLHDHRGIIVEVDEHYIAIRTDGYFVRCLAPDHKATVGTWADVRGGGFFGTYRVMPLAVFA